ncbi:MAG: glycosyltransferase family 4 protein [bacterium]
MAKKRLLFVLNDASFFISHRLPIAVAARNAGFDVQLAAPADPKAAPVLAAEGIAVHPIVLDRRATNPLGELRVFLALYRLYRRLKPDVVHHVTVKPVLYGSIARSLAGGGAVINAVPGLGYLFLAQGIAASLRRALVERLYALALRGARTIAIFQNPDDLALFVERGLIDPARATLIRGSGVDLQHFAFHEETVTERPIVVLPARMLRDKGVHEFVDAARILRSKFPAARFVLAGDADANRSSISSDQLNAWNHEGVVEWWGQRTDMAHVLRNAAIVCLPSYREGVPKALLEAAACGRAIVTTNVPGCREVVSHGENGLLVPPRDSRALAEALRVLLNDSEVRAQMGRAGRRRAEKEFDANSVVQRTLEIYEELLREETLAVTNE